ALDADWPELAARDHAGRGGPVRPDPDRDGVEVKRQADSRAVWLHRSPAPFLGLVGSVRAEADRRFGEVPGAHALGHDLHQHAPDIVLIEATAVDRLRAKQVA